MIISLWRYTQHTKSCKWRLQIVQCVIRNNKGGKKKKFPLKSRISFLMMSKVFDQISFKLLKHNAMMINFKFDSAIELEWTLCRLIFAGPSIWIARGFSRPSCSHGFTCLLHRLHTLPLFWFFFLLFFFKNFLLS